MRPAPSFTATGKLVSRALGLSLDALSAAFRPAGLADLPAVLELRRRCIEDTRRWDDSAYLRWRYRLGEPQRGLGELWVVVHDDRMLGMIGTEDMILEGPGLEAHGIRVMDILVDPQAEGTGLGVWMNQGLFERHDFTLAVGANPNSAGTLRRLFQSLPNRQAYLFPLDFRDYAARRAGLLGRGLGRVANLGWHTWHRLRHAGRSHGLMVRPIERFTDDLLGFIPPRGTSGTVRIVRSASMLNHRLLECPRANYQVLGAFDGPRCVGYAAARVARSRRNTAWLHLIDWQHAAGSAGGDILNALLTAWTDRARAAGCVSIQLDLLHADSETRLKEFGFLLGKGSDYKILGLHSRLPALAALARSGPAAAWCITDLSFDGDGY